MQANVRQRVILIGLGVMVLLAALHFSALSFFLYWRFPWFDLLTHFLGGAVIGCGALWIMQVYETHQGRTLPRGVQFFIVVVCALGVGGSWEIFEHAFKLFDPENYVFDTSIDMVMDTVGALMGWRLARRSSPQEIVPE